MGCTSEIWMRFTRERHAKWAAHVAEDMIKLIYAERIPDELPWVREAIKCPSLSQRYLTYWRKAEAYDLDIRYTALEWLRRDRTVLRVERCQDICRWTGMECTDDLVPQLFYAYALRFPQVPFTAVYRHEMTASGAIQLIRMEYDGAVMHAQEKTGERPMDEDDWSRELIHEYTAAGGAFVRRRTVDPMEGVKKARADAIARTMDAVMRCCRPVLVGLSGSIAYGLDTPESDIDIRGIFLNPPEELIGLRRERESLRPDDSDTVLYGLRRAMELLLDCSPSVLELLGLRKEHILYCSEDGQRILDSAPAFLSRRAIYTFNSYAGKRRRQIQKLIDSGSTDAKALAKEMTHLIRIYTLGIDLLLDGCVTTYRRDEHCLLMDIRGGKYQDRRGMPTEDFQRMAERYRDSFNAAALRTRLPPEPDWDRVNDLTMEIIRRSL